MDKKGLSLLFAVCLLFAMGLLMVFNTTAAEILDRAMDRDIHYAFIRQLLYAIVGFLCGFGVWLIGYQTLLRLSGPLLVFFSFLLVLVFVPKIGLQINGAYRWLNIFGNSFQPSEFVKYLIPMYYIQYLTTQKKELDFKAYIRLMVLFCIPMGLIMIEPDNGTVFIIGTSLMVLFILTRLKWTYWLLPFLALVILGGAVASQMQHVPDRIRVFMNPESDLLGKGHQPHQAKIAAGSGGLLGKGFGESLQKMNYLPEARSDYIAAIFAEEFGFLGMSIMILIYLFIGFIGYFIAVSCKNAAAFYLASLFVFLICFQAFLNLGVVSGLLPSKGINLPFFSQGGSCLLSQFIVLSLILNINKQHLHEKRI
jgi:cell division protein FtsW